MADNPIVNGVTVAGDDIGGGVIAQRMKVAFGVGGVATDVSGADPLPVTTFAPIDAALTAGGGADVATSSTLIVAANASRSSLILSNGSDTGVWITFAATGAATGMGVYLPAGVDREYVYSGAVCGVNVGTGTKRVGYVEL